MKFHIETDRLILRDLRESDVNDMFRLDSNAEVHRYLGNNPIQTLEKAAEVIAMIRKQYKENGIGRWAAIEKSSGKFIGWTGLKFITDSEEYQKDNFYDIGYRLHPDFWGKGYATESAKKGLEYAFREMQVNKIIGTCHEENKASRRGLDKCGLRFVKQFMYNNELTCDWLEITKQEWEFIQYGHQ